MKAAGESVLKPLEYYENNVISAIVLLKAMRKHKCMTLIFSSSACVYGDNPISDEHAPLRPINPYGQTKLMTE